MDFNIPFMKYRKIAAYASLALFVISIVSLSFRGLSLGLDFSGGTLVEVTYEDSVNLEEVRGMLTNNGFDDYQVVNFGSDRDVLIKIADQPGNSQLGDEVFALVQADDPDTEL